MKTGKAMKTKANFRKAAIRSGAVIVSFVLVSITVSAQGFWKKLLTNSSFNEIAIAMIETPAEVTVTEVPEKGNSGWVDYDKAFDPVLELEGWMTSQEYFSMTNFDITASEMKSTMADTGFVVDMPDSEESLEVEDWMTLSSVWGK